jgi:hypothetical protein
MLDTNTTLAFVNAHAYLVPLFFLQRAWLKKKRPAIEVIEASVERFVTFVHRMKVQWRRLWCKEDPQLLDKQI